MRTEDVDGRIVIDLGDASRDAVDVGPEGWRIIQRPPVRYVRPRGLLPVPRSVAGGCIDDLRPLVNVEDDAQFRLLVAWLVAAQRGRGPFPILCVQGEHGSAKSTCSRFVRHLVDPKKPILRSLPKDERDLAVAARASHALAFDNLSGLPTWLSDALCRVATGGGFATRSLYTNDEETIFDFVRPLILNGIDDVARTPKWPASNARSSFTTDKTRKAITFHDLRATGLTWMAIRGDEPLRIMQRAGHENFQTTQLYVREADAIRDGFGEVFPPLTPLLEPRTGSQWSTMGPRRRDLESRKRGASRRYVAGWTGLEPAASGVTGRRYNQLNYHPKFSYVFVCSIGSLTSSRLLASRSFVRIALRTCRIIRRRDRV